MHATHMQTPIGPLPIRENIAKRLHGMSDREVADETFKSIRGFINPEAFAELCARGLSGPGMYERDTYALINEREKSK